MSKTALVKMRRYKTGTDFVRKFVLPALKAYRTPFLKTKAVRELKLPKGNVHQIVFSDALNPKRLCYFNIQATELRREPEQVLKPRITLFGKLKVPVEWGDFSSAFKETGKQEIEHARFEKGVPSVSHFTLLPEELIRHWPKKESDFKGKKFNYYLLDHKLFEELKSFPENIDHRLYSRVLAREEIIYQGDGIDGMLVVNFPSMEIGRLCAMVISNTCDVYSENIRFFPSRIVYTPIFNLEKYKRRIIEENDAREEARIEDHIDSIKRQFVTQIFYLPKGAGLEDDSIVFLDRLNNCASDSLSAAEIKKRKIFTLSDYGFYLFLVKLSIHFTRVREKVERTTLIQYVC